MRRGEMASAALGSARAAAARRAAPAPRRARVACGVVRTGVSEKTDAGACKENFRFDLVGGKQATETLVAKSAGAEFVCHTIERPLGITVRAAAARPAPRAAHTRTHATGACTDAGDANAHGVRTCVRASTCTRAHPLARCALP